MITKRKRESALLFTSTEHASFRDDEGHWTVNIGNTTYAEKVDAAAPIKVTLANLFPNVTQYNNTFNVTNVDGSVVVTVPVGQYTATEYAANVTAQLTGINVTLTLGADNKFVWTSTSVTHGLTTITSSLDEWWEFVGVPIKPQNAHLVSFWTVPQNGSNSFNFLPNMSGEKLVHISCDKVAHGNLVHGKDGKLHDILITVPLTDVAYGFNTVFVPQEDDTYAVDYRYTNSLSSTLDFQLLDSRMRALPYPVNQHITVLLKMYHNENHAV